MDVKSSSDVKRSVWPVILMMLVLVVSPRVASGQAASGLAGVVRDATGAVLPGVSIEAASPALIEKVRSAVTDGQGQYKIIDLRPGNYTVTFTLAGFTTVIRDGIDLPAAFTATVNADLRVGALEESVTVTGQASTVDVQSVRTQTVLSSDVLDALPSQRSPQSFVPYISGVTGGIGEIGRDTASLSIHGSRTAEANVGIDGVANHTFEGPGGGAFTYYINQGTVQEVAVSTGGQSAEQGQSGIMTNLIPREGSNRFSGSFFAGYAGEGLQSDNLSEELRAQGLTAVNRLNKIFDVNPSWGGPIQRDRLWFYNSYRYWGTNTYLAGLYFNKTPDEWFYTPDTERQAYARIVDGSGALRLTWQANAKNKFSAFYDEQPHCTCNYPGFVPTISPEATGWGKWKPNSFRQFSWKAPLTGRVYVEASWSQVLTNWHVHAQTDPLVSPDQIGVTAQTGIVREYRAYTRTNRGEHRSDPMTWKASLSYVTGSHNFKVGFGDLHGQRYHTQIRGGDVLYRVNNALDPVPNQITLFATPLTLIENLDADVGVYVQDQWTINRLTLNMGVRYDYFRGSVPAQSLPATRFLPARSYAAVENVPLWQDVNPRLGAAYDLFGDGKTAVKFNVGRYVRGETVGLTRENNPVQRSITQTNRRWTDADRDFVPDCNLTNPLQNGECGQNSSLSFGQANVLATNYDPDVLEGWGKRGYNWEMSAAVQRELREGLTVSAEYNRRWWGNQTVTDNLAWTPDDYDPYCVTAPADSRLPGGGGNQVCGLFDLDPTKFGLTDNLVTFAKNFGNGQTERYDGVDLNVRIRLPQGLQLSGGSSTGRAVNDICGMIVDSPDQRHCDTTQPFRTQFKMFAVYPLPWQMQVSAGLQILPGLTYGSDYVATNAEIAPTLGRPLSGGANATIPLIHPETEFLGGQRVLDLRLSRRFSVGPGRLTASMDAFNLLNRSDTVAFNGTYGPSWLLPTQVLVARYLKFGIQVDF